LIFHGLSYYEKKQAMQFVGHNIIRFPLINKENRRFFRARCGLAGKFTWLL